VSQWDIFGMCACSCVNKCVGGCVCTEGKRESLYGTRDHGVSGSVVPRVKVAAMPNSPMDPISSVKRSP
jgi:hypothetical protein